MSKRSWAGFQFTFPAINSRGLRLIVASETWLTAVAALRWLFRFGSNQARPVSAIISASALRPFGPNRPTLATLPTYWYQIPLLDFG
jgi:hypothetical protein